MAAIVETGLDDVKEESGENIGRNWCVQLDDLIDACSLEIFKLSLRSELNQVQLDSITSASDLYDALKGVYNDEQSILSRIMYALKILGHRRYGHYALRKLRNDMPPLHCDQFDTSCLPVFVDCDTFCLYQRLAIACVILPKEGNDRFIKYFTKELEINHHTVKTPCEVLIKMVQADKLNSENNHDLMIKSLLSDDMIKKYQKRCEEIFSYRQTSTPNESKCSSCTTLDTTGTNDDRDRESTELTVLISDNNEQSSESTKKNPRLVKGPSSIMHRHSAIKNYWHRQNCTNIKGLLKLICINLSLIVCVMFIIGWTVLLEPENTKFETLYWSNTTVVIANSSRLRSLRVIQDSSYPGDYDHEIKLYRVNSKCNDLPTLTDSYTEAGDNFTSINVTTTYAWTGSFITLYVCGSTDSLRFQKQLDVLILKGLDLQFSVTNFYTGIHFIPGLNGEWMCREKTIHIGDPDYYTLIYLPQSTTDRFNYSVTYNIASVDLMHLQDSVAATLNKDQDEWDAPSPPWFTYDYCVIATLKNKYDISVKGQVHIQTHYNSNSTLKAGQAVIFVSVMLGLCGAIGILIIMLRKCVLKRKSVSFSH